MKLKYFGTDGIRGRVGTPEMDEGFVRRFGVALGRYLRVRNPDRRGAVHLVIGRDTRGSGEVFERIIVEEVRKLGVSVDCLGVVPTAAVAYFVDELEADSGLMITASHNSAEYNGLKLFNAHGRKQTADKEEMIERYFEENPLEEEYREGEVIEHEGMVESYIGSLCKLLSKGAIKGWKLVVDTANGATYEVAREVFGYLGAEVIFIGDKPDGKNINEGCGSEHPEGLVRAVREHGARLGIAFDGDGDRVLFCDEGGEIVHGDELLGIHGLNRLRTKTLEKNVMVITVQSNQGLEDAIVRAGGEVVRVDVGDRNVFYKVRELKGNFGGETSGHMIFMDYARTGDGMIGALLTLEIMLGSGKRLEELRREVVLYPQRTGNLVVREKRALEGLEGFMAVKREVEERLRGRGRVLVRYSGTEPKLRFLVEGDIEGELDGYMERLMEAARRELA